MSRLARLLLLIIFESGGGIVITMKPVKMETHRTKLARSVSLADGRVNAGKNTSLADGRVNAGKKSFGNQIKEGASKNEARVRSGTRMRNAEKWTAEDERLTVLVTNARLSQADGGSITLEITRGEGLCCSAWDWVGIYKDGSRLNYAHSHEESSPTFTARLSVPSGTGTYRFNYVTSLNGWTGIDLDFSFTLAPADSSSLEVSVVDLGFGRDDTGSITFGITRGEGLCCSQWDWIGIYSDRSNQRLSYVHSQEGTEPYFSGILQVPSKGGFSFGYATSEDGWQFHALGIAFSFGTPTAPPVEMGCIIPAYWWPTNANWNTLVEAAQRSGFDPQRIRVILNINSGHCLETQDSVWNLWIDRARTMKDAGFTVLAYVNLCSQVVNFACAGQAHQGNRLFNEVKLEIDKYKEKLGGNLAGFFLDDAGHSGSMTQPVLTVTDYVNNFGGEVIHNPGTISNNGVLLQASTVTNMREGSDPGTANPYVTFPGVPASKISMLLHQVPADAWEGYLQTAKQRGYGNFYATSGGWNSLPTYLEDMFRALA